MAQGWNASRTRNFLSAQGTRTLATRYINNVSEPIASSRPKPLSMLGTPVVVNPAELALRRANRLERTY
jgi:hypothetical protein